MHLQDLTSGRRYSITLRSGQRGWVSNLGTTDSLQAEWLRPRGTWTLIGSCWSTTAVSSEKKCGGQHHWAELPYLLPWVRLRSVTTSYGLPECVVAPSCRDQEQTVQVLAVSKSSPECVFNSLVPGRLYNISITSRSGSFQNHTSSKRDT
ncbi:hypothetical protein INR49_009552 [Caranx melampygus]|nr:hypothetical protein INR49_009552 [Caranx melampygus]